MSKEVYSNSVHDKNSPYWFYLRAQALLELEKYDHAIDEAKKGLAVDPSFVECHLVLCAAYSAKKKFEQAINEIEEAIRLAPDRHEPFLYMASVNISMNKPKEAEKFVKQALAKNAQDYYIYETYGLSLLLMNNVNQAIEAFEKSLKFYPNNEDVFFYLAECFSRKNNDEKRKKFILKALKTNPEFSDAHAALALYHFDKNERKKALEEIKTALLLNPSSEYTDAIKKLIEVGGDPFNSLLLRISLRFGKMSRLQYAVLHIAYVIILFLIIGFIGNFSKLLANIIVFIWLGFIIYWWGLRMQAKI